MTSTASASAEESPASSSSRWLALSSSSVQTTILSVVFAAWIIFAIALGIVIARKRANARRQQTIEQGDLEQAVSIGVRSTRTHKRRRDVLAKDELDRLTLTLYSEYSDAHQEKPAGEETPDGDTPLCAVCLDTYEDDTMVRVLACTHLFHADCIDKWLLRCSCRCPLCNADTRGILGLPRQPSAAKLAN